MADGNDLRCYWGEKQGGPQPDKNDPGRTRVAQPCKCPYCRSTFGSKEERAQHIADNHPDGPNPFTRPSGISTGVHGQSNTQPVYTGSMGCFGPQAAPQTSAFGAFGTTQGAPGTAGTMMNGGFTQPQAGGFAAQGGFGGMPPMQAGGAPGQMGVAHGQVGVAHGQVGVAHGQMGVAQGLGAGFGMSAQGAAFPAGGGVMGGGGMKAGFGTPTQPGAGQGFNQAGFGGALQQGGFGATAQPGVNAMHSMGVGQAGVGQAGVGQAGVGGFQAHGAAGTPGFGPQGEPTGAGGWGQQQSNPFMGQSDSLSQQPQQAQRSTNPFM